MKIRPITDAELPAYIETAMREYAEQKHTMGGVPREDALAQAARETERLFPGGKLSPRHAILVAEDGTGGPVGRLWMAPRDDSTDVAFIYAIDVAPAARGRGYGRALMQEAVKWSRENGFRTLALHVFGGNDVAIGLYESLGFVTTDGLMQLEL